MLTVAKLTPGQEAYYERSVAAGLDDYYAGRGESPGIWTGRGAAELGLDGVVEEGELGRLIRGDHPHTADRAPPASAKAQITVERIDPATGERRLEEKTLRRSPASTSSSRRRRASACCTRSATRRPGARSTRRTPPPGRPRSPTSRTRRASSRAAPNGVAREHGQGFVAAAYQHRTTRAQDPHLHTHVIVANMAQPPERRQVAGARRRADPQDLPARCRLPLPGPAARELSRSLGVEWETPHKGMAEIGGVPREVIAGVLDAAGAGGRAPGRARQRRLLRRHRSPRSRRRDRKEHVDLAGCARSGAPAPPSTASAAAS